MNIQRHLADFKPSAASAALPHLLLPALALLAWCWPQGAQAQVFPPLPELEQYFQIPDIALPPDPTPGQVLYSHELPQASPGCPGSPCNFPFNPRFPGASTHSAEFGGLLLPTAQAAVGLRVTETYRNQVVTQAGTTVLSNIFAQPVKFRIELVYRGEYPETGSFPLGKVGEIIVGGPGGGPTAQSLHIGFNASGTTCNFSPPNWLLTPITEGTLTSVGATSASQPFTLSALCTVGTASTVHFTLTDRNELTNRTNTLTPGAGSTAGGIKLQLMSGNTPIVMGSRISGGTVRAGANNWSFGARYIRTGAVSVGSVDGQAVLTADYQ